jgi:hypothetical protein
LAAALLLAPARATATEPVDAFEVEARRVLEDASLQSSNPESAKRKPSAREPEGRPIPSQRASQPRREGTVVSGGAVSLASVVFWVLIALVAAAILAFFWRAIAERWALRASTASKRNDEEARPSRAGGKPKAHSWQELAGQARYSDAVHCLLLEALQRLDVATRQGRALTSREMLQRARLSPQRRAALEELILAVERSLFGGADLGAGDYERCLDAFQRFGYG